MLLDLWSVSVSLRYYGRLAPQVRGWVVNGGGRGEHDGGGSFPGSVAGPVLALDAVEGLLWLVLGVGDALGVDGGVELGLHSSTALVDHRDGDVARLEAGAAGARRLVVQAAEHLWRV